MMQDLPQTAVPPILPPPLPQPEFPAAFVAVGGARVHYVHAGSGHPIVLIHGLIGSSSNWRGDIAALSQRASVYTIDLVNMGKSQRVAGLRPHRRDQRASVPKRNHFDTACSFASE